MTVKFRRPPGCCFFFSPHRQSNHVWHFNTLLLSHLFDRYSFLQNFIVGELCVISDDYSSKHAPVSQGSPSSPGLEACEMGGGCDCILLSRLLIELQFLNNVSLLHCIYEITSLFLEIWAILTFTGNISATVLWWGQVEPLMCMLKLCSHCCISRHLLILRTDSNQAVYIFAGAISLRAAAHLGVDESPIIISHCRPTHYIRSRIMLN